MPYQKVLFCHVWYFCVKNWKTSRYNISKNVCSSLSACFLFLLLLLLSNNTHHVLFYNYICYWNPFQYIIHYTNLFSCCKAILCASDFKRFVYSLSHQLLLISVLARLRFISWSSHPPSLCAVISKSSFGIIQYFLFAKSDLRKSSITH